MGIEKSTSRQEVNSEAYCAYMYFGISYISIYYLCTSSRRTYPSFALLESTRDVSRQLA